MDKNERIFQLVDEVTGKVMGRIKKTGLSYRGDENVVRRQIEATLENVVHAKMEGSLDDEIRRYVIEEVVNAIFGLGPIDRYLKDPSVWEIMVNGPKEIYIEREGKLAKTDAVFEDEDQLHFYIERLLSPSGRRVSEFEPYIDARLADGSRLNVVRRPVAIEGPVLTIRKSHRKVFEVQELIERQTLTDKAARFLKACVRNQLNIVLAGGPGSGKTTLLNIFCSFIPEHERIVTIEDTLELRMTGKHRVSMETRPSNIEGKGEITIRDLVRNALHMRPDRVIIGEVRGEEALDMLQCMNIGREGSMTTLHANSAFDALLRLETMAMMGSTQVSPELIRRQIVSAIDLIVVVDRFPDGTRRVVSVTEVSKKDPAGYALKEIYALKRKPETDRPGWVLMPTGHRPDLLEKFKEIELVSDDLFAA
jgi:pilus assembly protein CpaF